MGTIGCGIMFTGLLMGALSGSIVITLIVIGIGALLVGMTVLIQYAKEQPSRSWRAQYPTYRY